MIQKYKNAKRLITMVYNVAFMKNQAKLEPGCHKLHSNTWSN